MGFESGFDSKGGIPLARAMSGFWSEVVERDRSGKAKSSQLSLNCNQEPSYEELLVQRLRGVPPAKIREAAMKHRQELNGGFTPFSPATVRMAVENAAAEVDYARDQFPKIEGTEALFRSPA